VTGSVALGVRRLHIRFETRATKPPVFRMTAAGAAAQARSGLESLRWSLGEDLRDTAWLADADGLVTSNDIVRDPKFPIRELAEAAPRLRWIHIIGAGIEPLLRLDWLPRGIVLTNNRREAGGGHGGPFGGAPIFGCS
jgi:phosphoglycerate dehydrogenase-like enzyme